MAKIAPLFLLLMLMVIFAAGFMKLVFDVPFHGNFLVVFWGASLCILSGIAMGTVIATFSKSAQQAQLTSFFVNPLLTTASGAVMPPEAGSALAGRWCGSTDSAFQRDCPLQ